MGMWAGFPHGISSRSSPCWLPTCSIGRMASMLWPVVKEALTRFIESQPSFDVGSEHGASCRWVTGETSLGGAEGGLLQRFMTTKALQAFHWPFAERTL